MEAAVKFETMRDSAVAEQRSHNPHVDGSIPSPATKQPIRGKYRYTIWMGVSTFDEVCALAHRQKISLAEVCRRALRAYLNAHNGRVEPFPPHLVASAKNRRSEDRSGVKLGQERGVAPRETKVHST